MKKNISIRSFLSKIVSFGLAVVLLLTGLVLPTRMTYAASTTSRVPIICYTRYTSSNVKTYSDVNLKNYTGLIYASDQCTILSIYSNGAVKVKYPISGGRTRTAYVNSACFFVNTNFSSVAYCIGKRATAYRKSSGNATVGTVYATDSCIIIGHENGRTQLIFPIKGGYKLGWVSGTYVGGNSSDGKISLNVPSYKQYDNRWKNKKIGNRTIGSIGCLLTSLAMKYSYSTNSTVYPDKMKTKLSFINNDLIWTSVKRIGYSYTKSYNCRITNTIMSTIYTKLKEGKPVIIGGKNSRGGTHYVCITGYVGTNTSSFSSSNFKIHDPNSSSRTTLAQFLNSYPTVLRMVY